MKVIIAGSRSATVDNIELPVIEILCSLAGINFDDVEEVISGGANGVDKLGEAFAEQFDIPLKQFLPDYDLYGPKKAPLVRNELMAKEGDFLLLIWDGKSTGSKHIKKCMEEAGKPVYVYNFDVNSQKADCLLETQHIIDRFTNKAIEAPPEVTQVSEPVKKKREKVSKKVEAA